MAERNGVYKCNICGNHADEVTYGDIPEEKIKEQRERWSNSQTSQLNTLFQYITQPRNPLLDMFNEDWDKEIEIKEHDAGQKQIDVPSL